MGGRHARQEEKSSAIAMYQAGVFITEISQRTGFGTTTIFRWAKEAGVIRPFSERLAEGSTNRQFGRECIGKKGLFQTSKGGAWIPTDSTWEFARLEQLERMEPVRTIDRCRDRISYSFGGKDRSYIPDFYIQLQDGSVIVEEVKPTRWVSDPKVMAKFESATAHYTKIGVLFRVITEVDIGIDAIKAAAGSAASRMDPAAIDAAKKKNLARRAATQKAYASRKRRNATPDELEKMRAVMAAFQRKYRAANRKLAA